MKPKKEDVKKLNFDRPEDVDKAVKELKRAYKDFTLNIKSLKRTRLIVFGLSSAFACMVIWISKMPVNALQVLAICLFVQMVFNHLQSIGIDISFYECELERIEHLLVQIEKHKLTLDK